MRLAVKPADGLLTQTECLHDSTVALNVTVLEVVEQTTTLTYQAHEGTLCAYVLAVSTHVVREVSDACRKECDLAFG